jgi:hypothetical protein
MNRKCPQLLWPIKSAKSLQSAVNIICLFAANNAIKPLLFTFLLTLGLFSAILIIKISEKSYERARMSACLRELYAS